MPQSLSKVILHIILAPRIASLGLNQTFGHGFMLIGDNLPQLGAELVRIGGVDDHVHIVTTLPRTVSRRSSLNR